MKMMPLMMLSCSRTLVILGAVNWETEKKEKDKNPFDYAGVGRD